MLVSLTVLFIVAIALLVIDAHTEEPAKTVHIGFDGNQIVAEEVTVIRYRNPQSLAKVVREKVEDQTGEFRLLVDEAQLPKLGDLKSLSNLHIEGKKHR